MCTMRWYLYIFATYGTLNIGQGEWHDDWNDATPCTSDVPRNCSCHLASIGNSTYVWEPVSDKCFKGCMHNVDYSEVTWAEALADCENNGGELVRWNSQQCFDDIEGWLNCEGYTDSRRFWSAGGVKVHIDHAGQGWAKKKDWATFCKKGNCQHFDAEPCMGDVNITTAASEEDKIILHLKGNGILIPENQPPQANKMYICQTLCDADRDIVPPPPPPPPGGGGGDDPFVLPEYPVDCSLNVQPMPICGITYKYCYDRNCHICDRRTNAGCDDPLLPLCIKQTDGEYAGQYVCSPGIEPECPVTPATCTCNMATLTSGLPWEPISDFCFKGCMRHVEGNKLSWGDALLSCWSSGGDLVRWNSQECYLDIQSWLQCQGFTSTKRFFSAGVLTFLENNNIDKKLWKVILDGNEVEFDAPTMGNVSIEILDPTADRVVLDFLSNQHVLRSNEFSSTLNRFICMAPCDQVGPLPPPLPPPPPGGADDPPQVPPVDCSILPNCPSWAPYCYESSCHVCNVTDHDGCIDPNKPFCKLYPEASWYMCGDPHFVEDITGSDIPVCYSLFGVAKHHYLLLEHGSTSITGIFADTKNPNFAHFLGGLKIMAGGNLIHITGEHININGVRHKWGAAPSVALEQASADMIFNSNREATFISAVSGIQVGISRRGSLKKSDSKLDLQFTIPKDISGAKGIMGDMKSGTVKTEDNVTGELTVLGSVVNVTIGDVKFGPPGRKCWELPGVRTDIHRKVLANNLHKGT